MSYWWVNHKQTFDQEFRGGYIWSPKKNTNGTFNQTYENLTLVKPGDTIFSYAGGLIRAIGIITESGTEHPKPSEFGSTGETWSNLGWIVRVNWHGLTRPVAPKGHLEKIVRLLPKKYSPLQSNGNGNQGCYLASISDELGMVLERLISQEDGTAINEQHDVFETVIEKEISQNLTIDSTEKEQLIKSRKGQGRFRLNVERIENQCRVTGTRLKHLLIASHIKPWRDSSDAERLDGYNGFLFAPHVDKLFDQGWISFDSSGQMLISNHEVQSVLTSWGIPLSVHIGPLHPKQLEYLQYHRARVFRQV